MKISDLFKSAASQYYTKAKSDIKSILSAQKDNAIDAIMAQKPVQEIKEQEKQKEISRLMPYIIGGALILVYIGYKMRK